MEEDWKIGSYINFHLTLVRFFEWDRKGKQKRPYLVHFRDNAPTSEMKAMEELKEEGEGSTGANLDQNVVNGRLLSLAGLFDICVEKEEVYNMSKCI